MHNIHKLLQNISTALAEPNPVIPELYPAQLSDLLIVELGIG